MDIIKKEFKEVEFMPEFIETLLDNPTVRKFIITLIGVIIIFFLVKIIKKTLSPHVKAENWYMTNKAINVVGYILTLFLIGVIFNDRLGGITVTLGVASAGIAFALREVITSVAGWLGILFGGFYKTGDRVQLGGIKGDVIDIGILRTTLMELGEWVDADLYNGRIVRIANSFVFSQPVFNYSADFQFLWDEIKIPIKYGSDYTLTREILEAATKTIVDNYTESAQAEWDKMARKYILEKQSISSSVTMSLEDSWVEYTLRYIVDYKKRRVVKNKLHVKILKDINNTDGAIEFGSPTIEVSQDTNHFEKE